MIEAYSLNQVITADSIVPFTSVALKKGCTVSLAGSDTLQFHKNGVYQVNFTMTGVATTGGEATVQMYKNGSIQTNAVASVPGTATNVGVTLTLTTLVTVNNERCCCGDNTRIQFYNDGIALNDVNVSVVVTKIC